MRARIFFLFLRYFKKIFTNFYVTLIKYVHILKSLFFNGPELILWRGLSSGNGTWHTVPGLLGACIGQFHLQQ